MSDSEENKDVIYSYGSVHIVNLPLISNADDEDVSDAAGKSPYGDVPYADPGYHDGIKRYPIDCKHVKAAWSYIHQQRNSSKYTSEQLAHIKGKIAAAYKRCFGEEPPSLQK